MGKYRKIISITLASLLLAATFQVNGGTSLAKSAPAVLGSPAQFNLKAPRCGGGICEVNLESRLLYISQALKTKLDLAITFQNQNG